MRRSYRVLIALLSIFVIMFMNIGSYASVAHAWSTWENGPQWETPPEWETPPDWETPPEWEQSGWETSPEWNEQLWQNQSEWVTPYWNTSPVWEHAPWEQNLNSDNSNNHTSNDPNNPNNPNNSNNSSNLPEGPITSNPQPPYSPDYQNPTLDTLDRYNNTVSDNQSFFEFEDPKAYDGIKFVTNDVIGNTVNFADTMVRAGDAGGFSDYTSSRSNLVLAGFKTFAKGDPTVDAAYDVADVGLKGKEVYGAATTFNELRGIEALRKSGDVIEAANQLDDLYKAGKTFSPANAVVSAVTLPFAIKDTVDNVNKLNSASTSEDKTNAAWDLVGNSGEIITGLAPAVAMIPGAQPIAAGMVVVGGVLSIASLGQKLYRNREKVWSNVKEKAGKVKDSVTGFFKSVFG